MKLLRFLERRLERGTPPGMLHKWIRSGQVRVNKARAKAFAPLSQNDEVRLPPFAAVKDCPGGPAEADLAPLERHGVGLHAQTAEYLVLAKPPGLACQGGDGQRENLASLLTQAFAGAPFAPAPAHRLDKHTSGLVLAGKSHGAQRRLHELFKSRAMTKEYLAWVRGEWPPASSVGHDGPLLLTDALRKTAGPDGKELMRADPRSAATSPLYAPPCAGSEGLALCAAVPVARLAAHEIPRPLRDALSGAGASLLLLRLFTGVTHQLRVQLASRGFPIIGDVKYGGPRFGRMLLHAWALRFCWEDNEPPTQADCAGENLRRHALLPDWQPPFAPVKNHVEAAASVLEQAALAARPPA